jgi:ABC-2 type transport system permease protein
VVSSRIGRYGRTLRRFWGTALASRLEYRADMAVELLVMVGNLAGSLLVLSLLFRQGRGLGGWSWSQSLVVLGIYTLLDGFASALLRPNLSAIVSHVREGTLDFVLLKPIDSQFWVSTRTLSPSGLPEIATGLGLSLWAAGRAGATFSATTLLVAPLLLLAAALILYSIWFLLATTTIWFVKTWNATEVLRSALTAGRYPVSAYPPLLRSLLTTVLPVAFMTTVPAQALLGQASGASVGFALLAAGLSLAISRAFWLYALRSYTSASS